MIKLTLPPKPKELSENEVEWSQKFEATGESVWSQLREQVNEISYEKCAYCESKVQYLQIDHFYPKSIFPKKVIEWGNLLPSCEKCNKTKRNYNPDIEPIINPLYDNPQNHLYIQHYRYYGKTQIGKKTKEIMNINDWKQFVLKRTKVGNEIIQKLEDLEEQLNDLQVVVSNIRKMNLFLRKVKNIMKEGDRKEEYSATISTVILSDENYQNIENYLKMKDLWDEELINLNQELHFCALLK